MQSDAELREMARLRDGLAVLEAEAGRRRSCKFRTLFPESGTLSRDKYWWSLAFFAAGVVRVSWVTGRRPSRAAARSVLTCTPISSASTESGRSA